MQIRLKHMIYSCLLKIFYRLKVGVYINFPFIKSCRAKRTEMTKWIKIKSGTVLSVALRRVVYSLQVGVFGSTILDKGLDKGRRKCWLLFHLTYKLLPPMACNQTANRIRQLLDSSFQLTRSLTCLCRKRHDLWASRAE